LHRTKLMSVSALDQFKNVRFKRFLPEMRSYLSRKLLDFDHISAKKSIILVVDFVAFSALGRAEGRPSAVQKLQTSSGNRKQLRKKCHPASMELVLCL